MCSTLPKQLPHRLFFFPFFPVSRFVFLCFLKNSLIRPFYSSFRWGSTSTRSTDARLGLGGNQLQVVRSWSGEGNVELAGASWQIGCRSQSLFHSSDNITSKLLHVHSDSLSSSFWLWISNLSFRFVSNRCKFGVNLFAFYVFPYWNCSEGFHMETWW